MDEKVIICDHCNGIFPESESKCPFCGSNSYFHSFYDNTNNSLEQLLKFEKYWANFFKSQIGIENG